MYTDDKFEEIIHHRRRLNFDSKTSLEDPLFLDSIEVTKTLADYCPRSSQELQSHVRGLIDQLPAWQKDLAELYYFQRLTQVQIAQAYGVTQGSISHRIKRLHDAIRYFTLLPVDAIALIDKNTYKYFVPQNIYHEKLTDREAVNLKSFLKTGNQMMVTKDPQIPKNLGYRKQSGVCHCLIRCLKKVALSPLWPAINFLRARPSLLTDPARAHAYTNHPTK